MLTVVTLNAGDYLGRGKEYVERLQRGVARHLSDFRFVCFTDDDRDYGDGIIKRRLPVPGLCGWWNKLSLFKPELFQDDDRILFFDLDTLIVGPIDHLSGYDGDFAMLGPFFPNLRGPYSGNQSAVMMWRGSKMSHIWTAYAADGFPIIPGGDQAFINGLELDPDILQDVFPGTFASFKAAQGRRPEDASVICFHGLPRPHQCGGWVREIWV